MNRLVIDADAAGPVINRNIYGHFAEHLGRCIYEGIWVGEDSKIPNTRGIRDDVVHALRKIRVPVLRWPGGCFADEYHWQDGIGPREKRPTMINTHWGGVTENNHFGTHEFFDLCDQLECAPYICGNVGSGTVREMQQWVEYCTFDGISPMADERRKNGREAPWKLPFFGIGNENWDCGGSMRVEYYVDLFRRYQTYVRNFGGNKVYKIACGAHVDDYHWTETVMAGASGLMSGLSLHYYCESFQLAADFEEKDWFSLLTRAMFMDELVTKHSEIMDKLDPGKRIGLMVDEWGAWHDVESGTNPGFLYQQNTLRDAMVAAVTLNIFNQHCDRVRMSNIAQTINVLQAMILTDGEKMLLTPTYHVYDMFKGHQDSALLASHLDNDFISLGDDRLPKISVSASRTETGVVHITLCNLCPNEAAEMAIQLRGFTAVETSGKILTAATMQAHNTFDCPDAVCAQPFHDAKLSGDELQLTLPSKSIVSLALKGR